MTDWSPASQPPDPLPLPLVLTKTQVPQQRPGLVRRTDLLAGLTDDLDRAVTLIWAPAGYGKTTLLTQWASEDNGRRFGWVTLERSENDPVVFWRYVFVALRALLPGLAEDAWSMLRGPAPHIEAVLSGLLNSLADVPGRLVVVLDDYHVIENPVCHESVQFFIDHLPRSTQVALGTRVKPPLALVKVLARGLMVEVGRPDLQFTRNETHQAVNLVASSVSAEEAAAVHRRTEGWATAVYLEALNQSVDPERAANAAEHTDSVRQYLMDEMLAQLSTEDRDFFTRTSILDRLGADLCDHVTGRADSAQLLAAFAQSNLLLVPVDGQGNWYRLHQLLQEALRANLQREEAKALSTLHRRAKEWWLADGDVSQAIHHAIEAGELTTAGVLISGHWFEQVLDGCLETVHQWLRHYPEEAMFEYPPLIVTAAWIAAIRGDVRTTYRLTHAATHATYAGPGPDGAASFESSVAMLRAAVCPEGVNDAHEHAELAYQLEPTNSPWRPATAAVAGVMRAAVGDATGARVALIEAVRTPTGPDGIATYALGQLALLAASEGHWDEASEHAQQACDLIEKIGIQSLLSSGAAYAAAAAAAAHNGNSGLAKQRLRSITALQHRLTDAIPYLAFQIHLSVAETYLVIGDVSSASVHARSAATHLKAMGHGGVLGDRLRAVLSELGAYGSEETEAAPEGPDSLTARERQILALLSTGLSLREIGHELYVARNTTKTHVSRIYSKLDVSSRTAAIERARELQLI